MGCNVSKHKHKRAGSRGLLFQPGEHVANERVAFGSMPIADFLAGCTSFNLTASGLTSLQRYPTLNCLRTMGPEDAEGNKTPTTWEAWESFCTEHRLPDTFKEAAAEHVVVELAVNNFFKWREVGGKLRLTWEALGADDQDEAEAARRTPGMRPDTHRTQRALRLLQGDIVHKEGENGGSQGLKLEKAFEDFCQVHPAWSDSSQSFVFFRDHEGVKDLPDDARAKLTMTRIQHSGLCYMHAPAVLQHNLVTLHSRGAHHEMLNVAKYIVKFFDKDMIYRHVVLNHGASSITFLQNILGLGDDEELLREHTLSPNSAIRDMQVEGIAADLKKYGVALVAEYKVDAAFRAETSLTGNKLKGEAEGLHAMMLVGYRQDDDGQHLFLLQNWWRTKQFVEVSSDYLAAAKAKIVFVTEAVTEIPSDFPTNDNVFAMETEDLGEVPEPEM